MIWLPTEHLKFPEFAVSSRYPICRVDETDEDDDDKQVVEESENPNEYVGDPERTDGVVSCRT